MAYIHTCLETDMKVHPSQMDNELYMHLKQNLIDALEGKCFEDYGFITKIYAITEKSEGRLRAEDISASAEFHIKFSCKLACPYEGLKLIAEIDKLNSNARLIKCINGPYMILVKFNDLNKTLFEIDHNENIIYKPEKKKLDIKDFVKITIMSYTFSANDNAIVAICSLDDLATQKEVENYYADIYEEKPADLVKFEEFKASITKPADIDILT